ncbi:MAG: tetratricopeptide repeat protein, partial [Cyanobacteriota bacterium]|nr:tetratricopeptide repeat protein [Cyanobacteriota bacterium]
MDDSEQSDIAVNLYRKAILELRQRNIQEAILSCQEALKHQPNFGLAYQALGIASQIQGQDEDAKQYYLKALKLQPNLSDSYANLASISTKQKQWNQAIDYYRKAIEIQPNQAAYYRNLAQLLTQLNRQQEAAQYWYKALQIEPEWATPEEYLTLGNMLLKANQPLQAISCYQRTIQAQPHSFEAIYNLAEAFSRLESWQDAIERYEKALEFNQNSAILYQKLADAYTQIKAWDTALIYYKKSLEIDSNSPNSFHAYQKTAQILRDREQYDLAIEAYLQAIKIQPYYQWSYWNLWNFLAKYKKLDRALSLYQEAIKSYPNAPLVELNRGDVLTRLGQIKPAIVAYQNAIYKKIKRSHPEIIVSNWNYQNPLSPSFLIVGTQKGGTTSLYRYLEKHPQILPAIKKEVYFWNYHYKRGLDWYLSHFPSLREPTCLTGEATPNYIEDEQVAQRIAEIFPDMKLILLLRNPVERTISQYHHWVRLGIEEQSLTEAILAEIELLRDYPQTSIDPKYWQSYKYIWRGMYIEFLQQWMMYFPVENFLILKSEDFYRSPQTEMKKVFDFLQIRNFSLTEFKPYN